ncbi:hypothetical protein OESDEN_15960 [Oesophagostomum dentatum]|uniref:Uncharacterized protein n=1 Tax=Oesophagostomum dentatum TaxID=61180 RepID=A0A0B1SHC1_OESDE|nr:hypothetical protein OESDEN_15960 [Oesophagostomum dentatum]
MNRTLLLRNPSTFMYVRTRLFAGWFRECAIIPHTYDVDFAAFIYEYKPELLKQLENSKSKFVLKRRLGRVNDSFEFTFRPIDSSRPAMDLFWMYSSGNESWVGGTGADGSKFKYIYPK